MPIRASPDEWPLRIDPRPLPSLRLGTLDMGPIPREASARHDVGLKATRESLFQA
jgi:hypothetical protein